MYVRPTLIPYKGNISQLKIRFHDNDHLESTKGIIYMHHLKKRIKGGGSMKMLDQPSCDEWKPRGWHISISTSSPATSFSAYYNQQEGRHTHTFRLRLNVNLSWTTTNIYVYKPMKYTLHVLYYRGNISICQITRFYIRRYTMIDVHWHCLVSSANVSTVEWK